MVRKLVTVRRISEIHPIKGADRIEAAVIDGWQCVVVKDQFAAGDLAVFFEIDSFLPAADPRWAFLEKNFMTWNEQSGFRVKSQKMRGQISQGLLRLLNDFPEINVVMTELETKHGKEQAEKLIRDMSFENVLNVQKWGPLEKIVPVAGGEKMTVPFPSFIEKTDQERCQNLPNIFEERKDEIFQETTKMDGSSMTVYFLRKDSDNMEDLPDLDATIPQTALLANGRFGVCSKNVDLTEHTENKNGTHFWDIAKRNKLPEKLSKLDRNIAIQGELCGSSIQGNFEGFPAGTHDFFLFSVWDIDRRRYLKPREAEEMAKQLGLRHVQITGYHRLGDIATNIQEMLQRADGKGLYGKKREGIVLKHVDGDVSFKAISNSYLLKHGE